MTRSFNVKTSKNMYTKVGLQKKYDKINRDFITRIIAKMGFPPQFVSLVQWCISTPTFSIIINGTPRGFIHGNRGIHQGDHLSPCSFAIAVNFQSIKMESEYLLGHINPIYNIAQ